MKTENLSHIEQRVKSYWFTDGIGELIGGGLFILLGIYFFLQSFLGKDSILTNWLQASLAVLVISGVFAGRWLINYLKTRLTYPRTGFVEYRVDKPDQDRRRIMVMILGGAAAAVFVALAKIIGSTDWIPAATGLMISRAIQRPPSASPYAWVSRCPTTSAFLTRPSASLISGGAGTSRCPPGCGITSTSRSAAIGMGRRAPMPRLWERC